MGKPRTEPDPAEHGGSPLPHSLFSFEWDLNHFGCGSAAHNRLVCKKSNSDVQARRRKSSEKGGEEEEGEEEERDPATTLQAMAGLLLQISSFDQTFQLFNCIFELVCWLSD